MGKWSLENITAHSTDLNGETFGTNFRVNLRVKYTPSRVGRFEESPVLDWHEKFTTANHTDGTFWEFETNMFTHKPSSPTFSAWSKRYVAAYGFVTGVPVLIRRGSVAFYDLEGKRLPNDAFAGKPAESDGQKASIIREYLKKEGGIFDIEIHDVPAITLGSAGKRVERLLLFDCGLVEGSRRLRAMQYLNVNTGQPPATWQREFQISSFSRMELPTQGLTRVQTPVNVATPNTQLMQGEYL